MTAFINYSTQQQKKDEDDDMSLADIMSLRISTTPIEEKNTMWNDWSAKNELYHQQMQSSYHQLQYLQQQQMIMMMNNNSRRSSIVSSNSTSTGYSRSHYSPISPSSSSSSIKRMPASPTGSHRHSTRSIPSSPVIDTTPKRRQSLGKRIKKVFGMTAVELPNQLCVDTKITPSAAKHQHHHNHHHHHHHRRYNDISQLPSPASSTVSTISTTNTNNTTNQKKSVSFNTVIKLHETFSASEYDRRCDTSATCQKLTPVIALKIKEELNNYKLNDMFVHLDSRQNTHFFM
ncbi:hypothetical protein INT47_008671 [Mucor saturninus]|uniref:Uncharacterized protein n=1 Tax=Mucor saturninus TaxID=64648 RepID=A0A8H7RJH4_9FUNG|nr:hypothetical protein INT47_008671 [Mucor saturninus]